MISTTSAIFVFGASCSGKSSLCEMLMNRLGREWTYIDRDAIVDEGVPEEKANQEIEGRIGKVGKFIVDAQIPWREKGKGERYFLVHPPLKELLKRDEKRTERLGRDELRASYARSYVFSTYQKLSGLDKGVFNACFDSSNMTVDEEVNAVCSISRV